MNEIDPYEVLRYDPGVSTAQGNNSVIDDILQYDPEIQKQQEESAKRGGQGIPAPVLPKDKEDMRWKDAILEGIANIPESGANYLGGIYQSVRHPINTAKSMYSLGKGAVMKAVPGRQEDEKTVDAVVDFYKNRYGTEDKFKVALAEDPVGILGDVVMLLGPKFAKLEPISLGMKIASQPLKLIPEKLPIHLYQSAVKFGTTLSKKERDAVTRTALKASNQIMPSSSGMEKLLGKINEYNDDVSTLINEAAYRGERIPVKKLQAGLNKLETEMIMQTDQPDVVRNAFSQARERISEMEKLGSTRNPKQIQKIKQQIYKDVKSLYEQHTSAPAAKSVRMAIAKNAKESLETIIPELKKLNSNESELIALWEAVETKANRISNRDLIGIGLPVKMGTGSGVGYMFGGEAGGRIGSMLGFTLGMFDTPQVKAKIGLVINKLKEQGIVVSPTKAAIHLGLFQSGRTSEIMRENLPEYNL